VAVDWKHDQQKRVALHSTDSKIRGPFSCVHCGIRTQDVAQFIGMLLNYLHPTPIYEDSQPFIDVLEANKVTNRVKHIAVPIHYIHEQFMQAASSCTKLALILIRQILISSQIQRPHTFATTITPLAYDSTHHKNLNTTVSSSWITFRHLHTPKQLHLQLNHLCLPPSCFHLSPPSK